MTELNEGEPEKITYVLRDQEDKAREMYFEATGYENFDFLTEWARGYWRDCARKEIQREVNQDRLPSDFEGSPESPNHYTRLKVLTGVETWDILDFVAGNDPDMWNLGKYWFRMGHKEGQSTLTEKKKMLKYLERSIAKEEAAK